MLVLITFRRKAFGIPWVYIWYNDISGNWCHSHHVAKNLANRFNCLLNSNSMSNSIILCEPRPHYIYAKSNQ
jgi:hypothetical protein